MEYKRCCVVDAESNYKTFVLVLVEQDQETGQDRESVQHYTLQAGETLVNAAPPAMRPHAGAVGFVRPQWDMDTSQWTEGATAAEIAAWETEHPACDLRQNPTDAEQLRADVDFIAAMMGVSL